MTQHQREDAIEQVEGQLKCGYVDFSGMFDSDELEIIKEAISLLKAVDKFNSVGCTREVRSQVHWLAVEIMKVLHQADNSGRSLFTFMCHLSDLSKLKAYGIDDTYKPVVMNKYEYDQLRAPKWYNQKKDDNLIVTYDCSSSDTPTLCVARPNKDNVKILNTIQGDVAFGLYCLLTDAATLKHNGKIDEVIFQLKCIKEHLKFLSETADVRFDMEVLNGCISQLESEEE